MIRLHEVEFSNLLLFFSTTWKPIRYRLTFSLKCKDVLCDVTNEFSNTKVTECTLVLLMCRKYYGKNVRFSSHLPSFDWCKVSTYLPFNMWYLRSKLQSAHSYFRLNQILSSRLTFCNKKCVYCATFELLWLVTYEFS